MPVRRRAALAVAGVYAALTVAFAYPLSIHPASRVFAIGTDPDLWMWTLAWDTYAFTHQPLRIFDANIFYPAHVALGYSENLIGSALLAAPILWLTHNPVLAMNLVALVATFLCAWGAYVLARRLRLGVAAAAIAGLIFGFAPARFLRIEQTHLVTIQWLPFGLACLHAYLDGGRRRDLRLFLFFFTLQALTSGHGAVFLAVAAAALVAYRLATGWPLAPMRRLRDAGIAGLVLVLPCVWLFASYRAARAEVPSLHRVFDDEGSSLASYFASPSHVHTWILSHLPEWFHRGDPDAYLFPGYLPLMLGVMALGANRWLRDREAAPDRGPARRPSPVTFYAGLTLVSFWLTIGPPFGIWRLVYWMPVINFLRVPSRFVMLEMLGLAVLSAIAIEWLSAGRSARWRAVLVTSVAALLVVEFAVMPMKTVPYRVEAPAIDRWLNTQPAPFAIAEVPLTDSLSDVVNGQRNTLYMLHSMAHWQKTVHGFSGVEPAAYKTLYWQLTRFPDDESLNALASLGVKFVVMHPQLYPPTEIGDAEERFRRHADRLLLRHTEPDGRVYELRR